MSRRYKALRTPQSVERPRCVFCELLRPEFMRNELRMRSSLSIASNSFAGLDAKVEPRYDHLGVAMYRFQIQHERILPVFVWKIPCFGEHYPFSTSSELGPAWCQAPVWARAGSECVVNPTAHEDGP